jgi:hypoxanthine phosphoribosyltransferase
MGGAAEVRFAHNAERQLATLLDFYGVRWVYEPRTFVLDRHADGRARRAFTPDFFLPDFDLYIELTTLRQALVTRKNGKVRRLRELHPEVNLKVLYARDYQHLGARFGLEPPEQASPAADPVLPAAG